MPAAEEQTGCVEWSTTNDGMGNPFIKVRGTKREPDTKQSMMLHSRQTALEQLDLYWLVPNQEDSLRNYFVEDKLKKNAVSLKFSLFYC